jgi:hypothetical protein
MTSLLEQAFDQTRALPEDEQDAIAWQILDLLSDEAGWKERFAKKRDVLDRMEREAIEADDRGETIPLDDLL